MNSFCQWQSSSGCASSSQPPLSRRQPFSHRPLLLLPGAVPKHVLQAAALAEQRTHALALHGGCGSGEEGAAGQDSCTAPGAPAPQPTLRQRSQLCRTVEQPLLQPRTSNTAAPPLEPGAGCSFPCPQSVCPPAHLPAPRPPRSPCALSAQGGEQFD